MPRSFFTLFAVCALPLVQLQAQFDSGQISGYVRDTSQSVIAGATVTAISEGSNDRRSAITNANGYYVFANLPVGKYTVSVEVSGLAITP